MKKIFSKNRKAQQLVEFAIVAPILLIVLFIIIEFGSALNTRMTIAEGIKTALMDVNKLNNLNGDTAAKEVIVEDFVRNRLIQYLVQHNIQNTGSLVVDINASDSNAVALVNYQYNPYFLFPSLFGSDLPSYIPFSSSQVINPHIFKDTNIPAPYSSVDLSQLHIDAFGDYIETGALVDGDIYGINEDVREDTAFLLHFYEGLGTHPHLEYDHARLVSWEGHDMLPPNLRINIKTATLEARSPYYNVGAWFDTRIPYAWVASALGINHLIFTKYNAFEMLLPEDSSLLYKLLFNSTEPVYNRNIIFCGTIANTGDCFGDQRGTATVNERALRMNPKVGVGIWDDNYIIGTMEPINTPNDPTHDYQFINSNYTSYTDDYLSWANTNTNWQDNFFLAISSPQVTTMDDNLYHPDQTIAYVTGMGTPYNPFYEPFRYRLKFYERGQALEGRFDSTIAANVGGDNDNDDADGNNTYQQDIVQVYTDSDADGIPDAWDRDESYFDVDANGTLDGNQQILGNICVADDITAPCGDGAVTFYPDNMAANGSPVFVINAGMPYYKSTPLDESGAVEVMTVAKYLPEIKQADFVRVDIGGNSVLYYDTGAGYIRNYPTWPVWTAHGTKRIMESNFIHATLVEPNINLNPSDEFIYLENNDIFSSTSHIKRVPGNIW